MPAHQPQQPNNSNDDDRRTCTDGTPARGRKCRDCQRDLQCRYRRDRARDDLPVDVVGAIEKAALDAVEASMLLQRIEAAMSFRVYASTRDVSGFFDIFEQFTQN